MSSSDFGEIPSFDVEGSNKDDAESINQGPVAPGVENTEDPLDYLIRDFFESEGITEKEKTSTTVELSQRIVMEQEAITSIKRDISEAIDKKTELDKELLRIQSEHRKRVEELMVAQRAAQERHFDLKRELKAREFELAQLKRQLELELDKIRQSIVFKSKMQEFDVRTAGMYWREFAKTHQLEGAALMANAGRAINADKMGLGKTLTALMTADMLKSRRLLYIAPADLAENVIREFRRWAPHRPAISMYKLTHDIRKAQVAVFKAMPEITVVINYESWRRDPSVIDDLVALGFDTVIVDEAHTIKKTNTDAFKGVRDIVMAENCCPKCSSINVVQMPLNVKQKTYYWTCGGSIDSKGNSVSCDWTSTQLDFKYEVPARRSVKNVFPMTGTPILNRPQELFPLLHLILPETFVFERDYLNDYCVQDAFTGYWGFRPGGMQRLISQLSGRYIGRDEKSAGVDLPPQEEIVHELEITPEEYPLQYRIIEQLTKHAQIILESGKKITPMATIALITRKRQANVWPGGIKLKNEDGEVIFEVSEEVDESIKVDKVVKMVEEFTLSNERVVVFSQFTGSVREAAKRLERVGVKAVVLDGSTPSGLREQIKLDFDRSRFINGETEPKWDVVLCNYKTGGQGVNFTAATQTIIVDEEWNPGKRDQAYARTRRIGQTERTQVHILRLKRTVDTWLANLIDLKEELVTGFEAGASNLGQAMLDAMRDGDMI